MISIVYIGPQSILHIFLLSFLLIHSALSLHWHLWYLYSLYPAFCKFFVVFFEHLFWIYWVSLFFIPSDSLGFCLKFMLQYLCQLCYFSDICHSIFFKNHPLFPVQFSMIRDFFSFNKCWYLFSPVTYLSLHSYCANIFICYIFVFFTGIIYFFFNNYGCNTYQVVYTVMSNSFFLSSSIIPLFYP